MAKYFGYRHVFILPYNAQANGMAEASVKRVKLLLDRHTEGYAEWHKILPLAQLQLNSHVHSGTGISPYMALFGRPPTGIEQIENPALLPESSDGQEWLGELRHRMTRLHKELQEYSDRLKEVRAAEANSRRHSDGDSRVGQIRASTPDKAEYVRILRGSEQDARYIRKHGHGATWKYRYKVLEVRPHAVLLEVPTDGSVPQIQPWQSIRRCEPSPDHEVLPEPTDPKMGEAGVKLPIAEVSDEAGSSADDDDEVYEIEKVLSAEKVGGRYRLWIKWKGYDEVTPQWKSVLLRESCNQELIDEVDAAVAACKLRMNDRTDDEDDPVAEDEVVINEESDVTELAEKRRRRAPEKYSPTWLMDSDVIAFMQEVDAAKLVSEAAHRFIAVHHDKR
jgi:hypothetical protein